MSALSGCGPAGRAPGLGPGCREFESRHSDQNPQVCKSGLGDFALNQVILENSNCGMPAACPSGLQRQASSALRLFHGGRALEFQPVFRIFAVLLCDTIS